MPDENFHSTFAQICATILAIMLAFYGILGVNLAQQAQVSRGNILQNLGQVDTALRDFCDITEPPITSWSNWTISSDREYNVYMITQPETWHNSPVEVLNSTVAPIISNFTEAERMDNEVRDWLQHMNVSRFFTHYLLAVFSLHDLTLGIYREFPPPPVQYSGWHITRFVNQSFPEGETVFKNWAERCKLYFAGIAQIRSQIDRALKGISEAYLDNAKMDSQTLQMLINENRTDDWTIRTFQDEIQYRITMSSYYPSLFDSLFNIYSQITSTLANMERYHQIYNLAFSDILAPVIMMALTGVAIPMALLGLSGYIDEHKSKWNTCTNRRRWWHYIYVAIIVVSIIIFVIGTWWTIKVLWGQISELYLS
jgi:hypothetical protein